MEQRPYRGMHTFTEEQKNLFFGRGKPVNEIFSLLKNNTLTVIFGTSGIGKSSLINAGLIPKLRENFYLPILLRIPFSDANINPLVYTRNIIEAEVKKYIYKDFTYPENTTLWQFFREANYTGGAVIPVLILDQFEEYFKFGKNNKNQADEFAKEISDLIENRMPDELKNADNYKTLTASDAQNNCRVIISLREDFLAPLEDLSKLIPSLSKIRYRIVQLRGKEAFDAVYQPAKHLIDEATAIHLLKKIIPKKIKAETDNKAETGNTDDDTNEINWEQKDFEPYILSLFCYQVNEKRIAAKQAAISKELIDNTKVKTILNDYYNNTIKKYRRWYKKDIGDLLEKNLVSEEGYRLLKPVNSNEFKNVPERVITGLVNDRIIQIVNRNDINNIEISHDLLANVIHTKKIDKKENRKLINILGIGILVFVAILAVTVYSHNRLKSELDIAKSAAVNDSIEKKELTITNDSLQTDKDSLEKRFQNTIQAINKEYRGTVYFQVSSAYKSKALTECMDALKSSRFIVPAAETIKGKSFKNMVKYFHAEDEEMAKEVLDICNKYYPEDSLILQRIRLKNNNVSAATIEIWINK